MRVQYNKLVRDRIPEIIRQQGRTCSTAIMPDARYVASLKQKLVEESQEALQAPPDEVLGELADIYEVIDALLAALSIDRADILREQARKRAERGGFQGRICLLWTE